MANAQGAARPSRMGATGLTAGIRRRQRRIMALDSSRPAEAGRERFSTAFSIDAGIAIELQIGPQSRTGPRFHVARNM